MYTIPNNYIHAYSMYTYMLAYLTTSTSSKCILHRIIYKKNKNKIYFLNLTVESHKINTPGLGG